MSKLVTIGGRVFAKGVASCIICDKKIKYLLAVEVALTITAGSMLCLVHFWADSGASDESELIFKVLA